MAALKMLRLSNLTINLESGRQVEILIELDSAGR